MVQNITTTVTKARKDHHDDSAEFIIESWDWLMDKEQPNEIKALTHLRNNGWKIKKGQIYENQTNKQEGRIYTFKTLPIIHKICAKYNLYYGC